MKRRFMSLVIATVMVFSMLSITALAMETEDAAFAAEEILEEDYATTSDYELTADVAMSFAANSTTLEKMDYHRILRRQIWTFD